MSPHPEGPPILCVDATELGADAASLDVLARFALSARRGGYRVILRGPSPELVELIELAGLSEALPVGPIRPGSRPPRC